jgi:putative DNA primase/helicase
LLVHHAGKSGGQRGTSAREDILDTVIKLARPDDYTTEQGARFVVHLEKARGICGPEAKPFEAALSKENGLAVWITRQIEDAENERIASMHREGMSSREIAQEMGRHHSTICRRLKSLGLDGRTK